MINDQWSKEYRKYMDDVSKAKEKGIIKAVGVSCHDL